MIQTDADDTSSFGLGLTPGLPSFVFAGRSRVEDEDGTITEDLMDGGTGVICSIISKDSSVPAQATTKRLGSRTTSPSTSVPAPSSSTVATNEKHIFIPAADEPAPESVIPLAADPSPVPATSTAPTKLKLKPKPLNSKAKVISKPSRVVPIVLLPKLKRTRNPPRRGSTSDELDVLDLTVTPVLQQQEKGKLSAITEEDEGDSDDELLLKPGFNVWDGTEGAPRPGHPGQFANRGAFHGHAEHHGIDRRGQPAYYRPHSDEQLQPYDRSVQHPYQTTYPPPLSRHEMPTALPPAAFHSSSSSSVPSTHVNEAAADLRHTLNLGPHDPINLSVIPDTGEKPNIPNSLMVKLAIFGSPNKRLTLQEIYTELIENFSWYRANQHENTWKNSIRHLLSLKYPFEKFARPVTEPGKGSYWILDYTHGADGNKRERKRRPQSRSGRRRRNSTRQPQSDDDDDSDAYTGSEDYSQSGTASPDMRGTGSSSGGGRPSPYLLGRVHSMPMIVGPDTPHPERYLNYGVDPAPHGYRPGALSNFFSQSAPAQLSGSAHHQHQGQHYGGGGGYSHTSTYTPFRGETPDVKPSLEELQTQTQAGYEGRQLRPRPSQNTPYGERALSPTYQAYAKSRRHARG